MHGVAAAVGAWLDAGDDPVVVRAPLAEAWGGAGLGAVIAFGPGGQHVGALLGGVVDDVACRLVDAVWESHQRQVETVQLSDQTALSCGLPRGGLVTVVADRAAVLPFDWHSGRAPVAFAGPMGSGGPIVAVTGGDAGTLLGDAAERVLASGRSGACVVEETSLDLIHGPAGLDLGAGNAAEIALSICAEVLATRTRRTPRSLRARSGPIHR